VVRLIHCYQRGNACNQRSCIDGDFCVGVFAQTLKLACRAPFEGGIIASHSSLSGTAIKTIRTKIMFYNFFFEQSIL
jgi:hypothetical protein